MPPVVSFTKVTQIILFKDVNIVCIGSKLFLSTGSEVFQSIWEGAAFSLFLITLSMGKTH